MNIRTYYYHDNENYLFKIEPMRFSGGKINALWDTPYKHKIVFIFK